MKQLEYEAGLWSNTLVVRTKLGLTDNQEIYGRAQRYLEYKHISISLSVA